MIKDKKTKVKKAERIKTKPRIETYYVICNDCFKELDREGHGLNWRYNRVKEPCDHCADDDSATFRILIPEGLDVML